MVTEFELLTAIEAVGQAIVDEDETMPAAAIMTVVRSLAVDLKRLADAAERLAAGYAPSI